MITAGTPVRCPRVVLVTGTDTGVGKTIVTAAVAAALSDGGGTQVAVDKPTQTGIARTGPAASVLSADERLEPPEPEPADVDVVARLGGVHAVSEGIRLQAPMAPVAAARREGAVLPTRAEHLERIATLARRYAHVLVEGAGGVLVALTDDRWTLADLGTDLLGRLGAGQVGAVVVCRAGLGTLNHTALTVEALQRRQVPVTGLVIGSWPADPDEIDLDNRAHLSGLEVPLLGAVPAGVGQLPGVQFRRGASGWLPGLGRSSALSST